ncbi:MAG TPA: O-antigen ligase family protein, partial [Gemmatimonadales bacterium]|nr:O-antigen ligase family protein [Gemmatimonadales bacterium]
MTAVTSPASYVEELPLVSAPRRPRAWPVVAGFALLLIALLAAGQAGAVRYLFPVGCLAVAAILYRLGPAPYLEFAFWIWQVGPGVRRYVDYQLGGWEAQSPMSLAPFLVSAVAIFGVLRRLPELKRRMYLPWIAACLCILYGTFVGMLRVGLMPALHGTVAWFIPFAFGLYAALEWRRYPDIQAAMRRAFLYGSILLALYGCYQFINPPMWDRVWMVSSGMYSVGRAFPFEVRVFSMVNSPLNFATILVAGLFIALGARGIARVLSLSIGAIALLLSLVRSVWIAGILGFLFYLYSVPVRAARKFLMAGAVSLGLIAMVPIFVPDEIMGPTWELLEKRFLTFTDLSQDVSYKDRASFLDNISNVVVESPQGYGLGSTGVSSTLADAGDGIRDFDNGLFAVLYSLGWFGGVGLIGSAIAILMSVMPRRETIEDTIAKSARAVAATSLILIAGSNVFEGVNATILWSALG